MNVAQQPQPPRLVLFSGLGADERLLAPQRALPAHVEVVPWIEPLPREAFADYGRRIAQTIRSPRPFFIGGVSLGGMIALEAAPHVAPMAVILIASCRSCTALPGWVRAGRVIVKLVPASVQKWANLHTPAATRALGACTPHDRALILSMIRDTPASFLKWGLLEALRWRGPGELGVPVHQIHGERDRTIPCPRGSGCSLVPGGGHLINLTHPAEVNRFLQQCTLGIVGTSSRLGTGRSTGGGGAKSEW